MKYFGAPRSPICDELERIAAPVGCPCGHCGEKIAAHDDGFLTPMLAVDPMWVPYHRECFLRGIFGSVAHQEKWCSCYGGSGEDDPQLSKREAARAAVQLFEGRG